MVIGYFGSGVVNNVVYNTAYSSIARIRYTKKKVFNPTKKNNNK